MKVVSLIDNNISEVEVVTTSGGFANNVFFTNIDSDIIGYKKLSNTADASVTNLSATVIDTDGQKIARSYLFDLPIGVDTHDAGIWSIFYNAYVDSAVGDTRLIFEPFMRASNGNETTLFTEISPEINNTTMQRIEPPPINQPQFTVDANSRFGVRIKVSTTSNIQKTVHTSIGGENASYFNSPIAIRHRQLRGLNDDTNYQHITSTQVSELHTHINKTTLDVITDTGDGTQYLANDGTYKSIGSGNSWYNSIINGSNMFYQYTNVGIINGSWDNLISAFQMFYAASGCTEFNINKSDKLQYASYMFRSANFSGLTSFTLSDMPNITDASNMFYSTNFSGLTSFTLSDMPNVTNTSNMFNSTNFSGLTSFTLSDMPNVTDASNMFRSANFSGLTSFTLSDMPNVTNTSNMFNSTNFSGLTALNIPMSFGSNTTGVTFITLLGNATVFTGSLNIYCKVNQLQVQGASGNNTKLTGLRLTNQNSLFTGTSPQVNVSYTSLDATALNQLFNDLPTLTGKTINITGSLGASTCDRSIATAKNWTVVG